MSVFHRHVWKVIAKAEQPSPWDEIKSRDPTNLKGFDASLFRRTWIVTYRCARCHAEKVERV